MYVVNTRADRNKDDEYHICCQTRFAIGANGHDHLRAARLCVIYAV